MVFRKLNIALLSDSCFLKTGYATQNILLGNALAERGHNVIHLASNYIGQTITPPIYLEDKEIIKFTVMGGGREAYFKDLLPIYMKMYNIDVLYILLDTFMLYPWLMQLDLSPAKVIFHFPSDGGGGMPLGCDQILRFVDKPIAMAKFARDQVKLMYDMDTDYIPLSVNPKIFYPLTNEQRTELKRRWGFENKFVVGSVFRNQGRKMADRTIKAFKLFADLNPDTVLFLHTDPEDAAQVFHMYSLIARYNLQNRIVFSGMKYFKGFNLSQMNEVYNLMDCFILTTSGEGFGVPLIEAMSCKIPVICTDYTTTREIIEDNKSGLVINLAGDEYEENPRTHTTEVLDGTLTGSWNVERGICSVRDAAKKLQILKNNPELCKELGENGRKAVLREYDWEVVKLQWIETIEKLGNKL